MLSVTKIKMKSNVLIYGATGGLGRVMVSAFKRSGKYAVCGIDIMKSEDADAAIVVPAGMGPTAQKDFILRKMDTIGMDEFV